MVPGQLGAQERESTCLGNSHVVAGTIVAYCIGAKINKWAVSIPSCSSVFARGMLAGRLYLSALALSQQIQIEHNLVLDAE